MYNNPLLVIYYNDFVYITQKNEPPHTTNPMLLRIILYVNSTIPLSNTICLIFKKRFLDVQNEKTCISLFHINHWVTLVQKVEVCGKLFTICF